MPCNAERFAWRGNTSSSRLAWRNLNSKLDFARGRAVALDVATAPKLRPPPAERASVGARAGFGWAALAVGGALNDYWPKRSRGVDKCPSRGSSFACARSALCHEHAAGFGAQLRPLIGN